MRTSGVKLVKVVACVSATWSGVQQLFTFELHILVRRREDVAGDEPDPRLLNPRPDAVQWNVLPDRRDHDLLVDLLLDAMQESLALLAIQLARLLPEEPVDVRVAAIDVRAAANHQGFDPGGGVSEGAVAALNEASVFLLYPPLLECRSLDGAQLHANADRVEIVNHRLPHIGQRGIAEIVAGVEAVGISGFGETLTGLDSIGSVARWLPVELEARGHQAPGEPGEA